MMPTTRTHERLHSALTKVKSTAHLVALEGVSRRARAASTLGSMLVACNLKNIN